MEEERRFTAEAQRTQRREDAWRVKKVECRGEKMIRVENDVDWCMRTGAVCGPLRCVKVGVEEERRVEVERERKRREELHRRPR